MHIAIDLDEVLCESVDAIIAFHKGLYDGKKITREQITTYNLRQAPGFESDFATARAWFHDYLDHYSDKPDPCIGAKDVLTRRKDKGYTLSIVTARPQHVEDLTNKRIQQHFPGLIGEIHYASHFTDDHRHKSDICNDIGAQVMIEDNLGYAQELAENGIPTYLIQKPWNQHYCKDIHDKDVRVVKNWEEIVL